VWMWVTISWWLVGLPTMRIWLPFARTVKQHSLRSSRSLFISEQMIDQQWDRVDRNSVLFDWLLRQRIQTVTLRNVRHPKLIVRMSRRELYW
jgi:hypothetical protein